jgi:hypothetical protein
VKERLNKEINIQKKEHNILEMKSSARKIKTHLKTSEKEYPSLKTRLMNYSIQTVIKKKRMKETQTP